MGKTPEKIASLDRLCVRVVVSVMASAIFLFFHFFVLLKGALILFAIFLLYYAFATAGFAAHWLAMLLSCSLALLVCGSLVHGAVQCRLKSLLKCALKCTLPLAPMVYLRRIFYGVCLYYIGVRTLLWQYALSAPALEQNDKFK